MAAGPVFPAFLRIEHQRDGSAKSAFLADVEDILGSAEKKFQSFSSEAKRLVDSALSVERTSTGSLDLGVPQLQAAAQAQQARAIAAREVAAATRLAAKEEGDYGRQARLAVAATEALAREEEQAAAKALAHAAAIEQVQERLSRQASATNAVVAATGRGTDAFGAVTNSVRASRVAYTQLGQQMQDVVVQAQMGTSAITIFTQQVPQAAFALSGLGGTVGTVARFLAGPWGAAVFAATAVLGPLIFSVLGFGSAADEAKGKAYDFSEGLDVLTLSAGEAVNAMKQLEAATRSAIAVQGTYLESQALVADQSVKGLEALLSKERAELAGLRKKANNWNPFADGLSPAEYYRKSALEDNVPKLEASLASARASRTNTAIAASQARVLEGLDPRQKATGEYNRAVGNLNKQYEAQAKDPLAQDPEVQKIYRDRYEAEFKRLTKAKDDAIEAAKEKPDKKKTKKGGGVDRAAREAQRLGEFAEDAGKKISRIEDAFANIPPEVQRVNAATGELNDIISDLNNRKPEGFEELVAQAERLKAALPGLGFAKAMDDLNQSTEQNLTLQKLVTGGREKEAAVLQEIYRLEQQFGPLQAEQREEVSRIVTAEQDRLELLHQQQEQIGYYLDASRSVRSEIEAILSGQGKFSNFKQIFQQLQGKVLAEQLFGDVFRDLDKWVKQESGIGASVDILATQTERAGGAAGQFADALVTATARIEAAAAGGAGGSSFASAFSGYAANDNPGLRGAMQSAIGDGARSMAPGIASYGAPIVVNATKKDGLGNLTPAAYFERLASTLTKPLLDRLSDVLGPGFAAKLGDVINGGLAGFMSGGPAGGIIGALKGLPGLPKGIADALGKMGGGAATGTAVAGIGNALGLKMSTVGSQIGGALGSMLPIPGGDIIGSVVGGLIGKLFKKTKKGYAIVNQSSVTTGGNSTDLVAAMGTAGEGLQSSIRKIADTLGADVGNYMVSIARRSSGYFHVDGSGAANVGDQNWHKKAGANLVYNGKDEAEAMRSAILNALQDGAIKGIREATMRLLKAGKDIDGQLQKALDFEGVFSRLKAYKDPVGAALDTLDKEFRRLQDIFAEAGASTEEYAQLEELYGIQRAKAIKEASDQIVSALRSLNDELNIGDNGLSLRDRRSNALAKYNPLAERVRAGDVSAYEDYAQAARDLLDIQRQISGSQSDYFTLFNEVRSVTQSALDATTAIADASAGRDSPFSTSSATAAVNDNASVVSAIDAQTEALLNGLGVLNSNLVGALQLQAANSGFASDIQTFVNKSTFF